MQRDMIYEKTLRQLNTVFPTLNIKMPSKKVTVRSLVQEIECPSLTNNDFVMLRNSETALKPLNKLSSIINIWMKISQENQKARQQQQMKQIKRRREQQMQQYIDQCNRISSKSQFIMFISQKGGNLLDVRQRDSELRDYKQIYICKQIEFYNTIGDIGEEEYFNSLERLNEGLGVMGQLINRAVNNMGYVEEVYDYVEGNQLFKKKDNVLNRVINYNLKRTIGLINRIERIKKNVFDYQQEFVYSIVRIYYLIYLSRKEIQSNFNNGNYLLAIETFLCQRTQKIFPRLYERKIGKSLIMLDRYRNSFMNEKYIKNEISIEQRNRFIGQVLKINSELKQNKENDRNQQQFFRIFFQVQNLILKIQNFIFVEPNNEQWIRYKNMLKQCEILAVKSFSKQDLHNYKNSKRNMISHEKTGLHLIPLNGQKQQNLSYKLNGSIKNTLNERGNKNRRNGEEMDIGEDVFLYDKLQDLVEQRKKRVNKIDMKQHQKECMRFLNKIESGFGERLYDAGNMDILEMNALISVGPMSRQKNMIQMISKNVVRPEISEQNIERIFKPWFRFSVLKILHEKLIEIGYKIAKIIESQDFYTFPENIKGFILKRNSFLKTVNKQIQKVLDIASIINRLEFKVFYDICEYETYDIFLKVLLAHKQARAYQLSFRDEKQHTKQAVNFVNKKIYTPFIDSLLSLLPEGYGSVQKIIEILDYIQFFVDFKRESQEIIMKQVQFIENQKDKNVRESLKRELWRILKKWMQKYEILIENKYSVFDYKHCDQQYLKVKEVMMACNNQKSKSINDPMAIKILRSM